MILTQLAKNKLFCVTPRIYKSGIVLTGVAYAEIEPQMDRIVEALSQSAKKPVSAKGIKYASSMFYFTF
jgi:hypothetical protein